MHEAGRQKEIGAFDLKDVTPTPGCFLQEWQTKDLRVTWFARVANKGLSGLFFSMSCTLFVRVANKGLKDSGEWQAARRISGADGGGTAKSYKVMVRQNSEFVKSKILTY